MRSLFAAVFLVSMAAAAVAESQEDFRRLDGSLVSPAASTLDKAEGYNQLTISLRVPFLGGKLDNEGDKWTDFFDSAGIGFGLDGSYLWSVSQKVAVGIYVAFDIDDFSGKTITADAGNGPVQEAYDDLVMTRFVVGARVRETFGVFFMDQNIGFGWATYSAVNANVGGTNVGIIDATFVFAFELGLRFGFAVSPTVDLGMSLTYNYNGAPNVSSDISQVAPGLRLDSQANTVLGFFVNINF